jgi:DNA-binding transcriptional ArsR family regulator
VPRKKQAVVLTDPRAIRALAHPARQRLIDELYGGRVLTATECAELVELTPSAVSYHLRALARWGILERAEPTADGRQRPWRAPASSLKISSPPGVAGRAAGRAVRQTYISRLEEVLEAMPDDDPWKDLSVVSRGRLWLTKPEAAEFARELGDLVTKHRRDRTNANRPPNTRLVNSFIACVPTGEPPEGN